MRKVFLGIIIVLLLGISSLSYAFQFEDYEWGTDINQVQIQISKKRPKRNMRFDDERTWVFYMDKIFKLDCTVSLSFTPISKRLAFVIIRWKNIDISSDIARILKNKYGNQHNEYGYDDYKWWGPESNYGNNDNLNLKNDGLDTILIYQSGDWSQVSQQEKNQMKDAVYGHEYDKF